MDLIYRESKCSTLLGGTGDWEADQSFLYYQLQIHLINLSNKEAEKTSVTTKQVQASDVSSVKPATPSIFVA